MAFGNLIITAAGQSMLASAQVGGGIITPTTISAGNGFVSGTDDPTTFTALKSLKWAGVLPTSVSALTPRQATVSVDFIGSSAPSSFKLNEIGVYAKQGAGSPILFAYTSRTADDGDTLSAGVTRTYALVTGYTNVTAVSLVANLVPAISPHAPTHIISDANPSPTDPLPVATTITTGLLPRLTGFLTDIFTGQSWKTIWAALAGTDPKTVLVGSAPAAFAQVPVADPTHSGGTLALANTSKQAWFDDGTWKTVLPSITSNSILYIATTGNNSTAIVNDPSHPWLTVQGALGWLLGYYILSGVTVTISIAAGIYENATPIYITHPQGSQIKIIGTASTVTVTSASFSAGTVTITAPTGTFSGWQVGDMVNVDWPSTGSFFQISGTWILSAVAANGSTISYASGWSSLATALGSSTGGQVTRLQTRLNFSVGVTGLTTFTAGLGLLQYVGVFGRSSGSLPIAGFVVTNGGFANIDTCGFYGWTSSDSNTSWGVAAIYGGNLTAIHVSAGRCANNFYCTNGFMRATDCWSSVAAAYGYRVTAGQAIFTTCRAVGAAFTNFQIANGSYAQYLNCNSVYGFNDGIDVLHNSNLAHGLGGSSAGNANKDLYIANLSIFNGQISGSPALTVSTVNISPNALSSTGSLYLP